MRQSEYHGLESKNTMYHAQTEHIDMRYHLLRSVTEERQFQVKKIHPKRVSLICSPRQGSGLEGETVSRIMFSIPLASLHVLGPHFSAIPSKHASEDYFFFKFSNFGNKRDRAGCSITNHTKHQAEQHSSISFDHQIREWARGSVGEILRECGSGTPQREAGHRK